MRREKHIVRFLIFFAACIALLSSCTPSGGEESSILWYQEGLRGVQANISVSETVYSVQIKLSTDSKTIEITAPENIKGVCIIKDSGGTYAVSGSTKIPISDSVFEGILPFFTAFELSEENIARISVGESGGTTATVQSDIGTYTVFTDTDGTPNRIDFEGERVFQMTDIVLER